MSTRCNVEVKDERGTRVMLYRHHDGMPKYMLPKIREAMVYGAELLYAEAYSRKWSGMPGIHELEVAGKAAGLICSTDPLEFEVQEDNEPHGDISNLYKIELTMPSPDMVMWKVTYDDSDGDELVESYSLALGYGFAMSPSIHFSDKNLSERIKYVSKRARMYKEPC